MSNGIPTTVRVSRSAAGRLWAMRVVYRAGVGLAWGAAAAVGLAGAAKIFPVMADAVMGRLGDAVHPLGVVLLPAALGLAAGAAAGLMRPVKMIRGPREEATARRLRDRLATAVMIEQSGTRGPFEQLALTDAEAASRRVAGQRVVRVSPTWHAAAGVALAAAAGLVWWLVPARSVVERVTPRIETAAQVTAAQDALREAREALEQAAPASEREVTALRELEEELARPETATGNAATSAARALEEAASTLDREAQSRQGAAQALERLAQAAKTQTQSEGEDASSLSQALAANDPQAAAAAVDELRERMQTMTEEERMRAAEQMRELAAARQQWEQEQSAAVMRSAAAAESA
ncbi:MAG: hypothetical protein ACK5P8_01780, partial [Phycisphaerae bacterium]